MPRSLQDFPTAKRGRDGSRRAAALLVGTCDYQAGVVDGLGFAVVVE
jgi:hypothetical protein